MRIRSIAAVVLVAAGLSVTLTGAAAAGEPDDAVIVRCEGGEAVVREPTDEERDRLRALPPLPGAVGGHSAVPAEPRGGHVRVAPAPGPERGLEQRRERPQAEPAEPGRGQRFECAVQGEPPE